MLEGETKIVSLEPTTLDEMFDTILLVGEITDREQAARQKVLELRGRLDRVREHEHARARDAVCECGAGRCEECRRDELHDSNEPARGGAMGARLCRG